MATNPTINGKTLSTGGQHSRFEQPRSRVTISQMPSVDGALIQSFGHGPQQIIGRGSITAASHAAIKAAVRTIQNASNHTPGDYLDTDNVTHGNCILLSYDQLGDINRESATSFWVRVTWVILKLVAT